MLHSLETSPRVVYCLFVRKHVVRQSFKLGLPMEVLEFGSQLKSSYAAARAPIISSSVLSLGGRVSGPLCPIAAMACVPHNFQS
jgi:hypothetical protein